MEKDCRLSNDEEIRAEGREGASSPILLSSSPRRPTVPRISVH